MLKLSSYEKRKGWWIEERATVPCALPKDGLMVVYANPQVLWELFMK